MVNEQPDRPKPIRTPAERSSMPGVVRIGHQREAERVEQRPDAQHARGAEAVGDRTRKRLANAPQQVLQREREREHVAAPAVAPATAA